MTRWATLAIGFLAFCSFPVTGPAQTQSGDGWITLFDGKNLDHWQGDGNANFAIDDGSIVAKDKKDAKTTAFLISKEKYKDFEIYAEFWVSNDANSGIFIRCEDPKKPGAKTCYECNIFDTRPDPSYGTGAIVYHAEVNPMPKVKLKPYWPGENYVDWVGVIGYYAKTGPSTFRTLYGPTFDHRLIHAKYVRTPLRLIGH